MWQNWHWNYYSVQLLCNDDAFYLHMRFSHFNFFPFESTVLYRFLSLTFFFLFLDLMNETGRIYLFFFLIFPYFLNVFSFSLYIINVYREKCKEEKKTFSSVLILRKSNIQFFMNQLVCVLAWNVCIFCLFDSIRFD